MHTFLNISIDQVHHHKAVRLYSGKLSKEEIKNEPGKIIKYFTQLKDKSHNIICCYEAGPSGYTLYRQLEEMEITCHAAAPSILPRKPGDRIKTDSRDAVLLAKTLRNQEIVNICTSPLLQMNRLETI